MKLTIGFSPCPNDTFIFEALVNGKTDTCGLEFEVVLEDVQTLNEWARQGKLDVSKVSYGVLPLILDTYRVIKTGGALGMGVGPLLISREEAPAKLSMEIEKVVNQSPVAIPGENTTAHFLFSQAFPRAANKVFLRFDQVEDFVMSGKGLGVIIHENRFTYRQKGLFNWADLGFIWEQNTGLPIPLGGIIVKKGLPAETTLALTRAIQQSLEYANKRLPELSPYTRQHAQEMEEQVMRQHIDLYVNDFSYDMQAHGRKAVLHLVRALAGRDFREDEVFA